MPDQLRCSLDESLIIKLDDILDSLHIIPVIFFTYTECDNITPEQYRELSQDGSKVKYNCSFCRSGEDKKLVTP